MALIYVVEDDEPIRRELIDILARAGFEIEACESFEHVSRDILAAAVRRSKALMRATSTRAL